MIWLTWRQFRVQAWVATVAVAAIAVALGVTAPGLFDVYDSSGLAACTTACDDVARAFTSEAGTTTTTGLYLAGGVAVVLLPALIGVFWGAPLVARELETGTHRLVWNQTISRGRWLAVKLIGVGLAAVLTAGLISLVVTWWSGPFDEAGHFGRITPLLFSARGVVPLGYAALAFVAGVAVGMVTRRVVVSMAVTLLLAVVFQLAGPFGFRAHLSAPVAATAAFSEERISELFINSQNVIHVEMESPDSRSWVLSNVTVGRDGREFSGPADPAKCGREGSPDKCHEWLAAQGLTQKITYVPADRFWTLQWRELGLLMVMSGLLSAFCIWWIRRRVS